MSRVRIIGGGLSGVLAAFEAHRLGARDIELHERFGQLGGSAMPPERHGVELRERRIAFGPRDEPVRRRLEANGIEFDDAEEAVGSVSPSDAGPPIFMPGFVGPALPCGDIAAPEPVGPRLADRVAAYPDELRGPLERYLRWRLPGGADEAHACAAPGAGLAHVLPLGVDANGFAAARRADPRIDAFFAMPVPCSSDSERPISSEPRGGFGALFRRSHRALRQLGVRVVENSLIAPRQALVDHRAGDLLVWTAGPAALLKMAEMPAPRLLQTGYAAYVFAARWTGPRPFLAQNFTADGSCSRVQIYESAGRTLIAVECVREADAADLRYEIHRLLHGFEGDLALGELLYASVKPRWTHQTVAAVAALRDLRVQLAARHGPGLVTNAWEREAPADRFAALSAALASALKTGARGAHAA